MTIDICFIFGDAISQGTETVQPVIIRAARTGKELGRVQLVTKPAGTHELREADGRAFPAGMTDAQNLRRVVNRTIRANGQAVPCAA